MICYICHTEQDTRPYGVGGEPLCYDCLEKDAELEKVAKENFTALLDASEAMGTGIVLLGEQDGPMAI